MRVPPGTCILAEGRGVSSPVLSARDLSGCEHRVALDFAVRDLTPGGAALPADAIDVEQRKQAAADHRERVRELLRAIHSDQDSAAFTMVDKAASRAVRVESTLAAAAAGATWIADAVLPTDRAEGRRGHSEFLVRSGTGYLPVIVVNHRVTLPASPVALDAPRPSIVTSPLWGWHPGDDAVRSLRSNRRDQTRLLHLFRLLDFAGIRGPALGGVIGLDADCIAVYDLAPLLADYDENFRRRRDIAAGQLTTTPSRVGECRGCRWWSHCEPQLTTRRDVSLVVNGSQTKMLTSQDITTIDELAASAGEPPEDWVGGGFADAVAAARCWLTGTPLARRHDDIEVHRADVEVDVDMESFGEDGAYLWGTLLTDNTTDEVAQYRPFVTWRPLPTTDEARSFAEFWTWLTDVRAQAHSAGKTFAAYCYSEQAENRWLRGSADRFAGHPGIPTRADVDDFIASDEWVDIFAAVSRNFLCPNGKGLKKVAPVAGFAWRDDDAGGAASMDWYRHAVGLGVSLDESQRRRLLEYNEDDVRATKVLREWMDSVAQAQIPTFDGLAQRYFAALSGPEGGDRVEEAAAAEQG